MKTLAERLEEAKARRKTAESAITDADKAEIQMREEMAREEAAAKEAEEQRRALDLARRLDAARERLGDAPLRDLQIKDSPHNFILKNPGAKAYNDWERGISKTVTADVTGNGKVDRAAVSRAYAVAAVEDWNGIADFGPSTTNGADLIEFLKNNPAIVAEIVNVAVELSKVAAEARKS